MIKIGERKISSDTSGESETKLVIEIDGRPIKNSYSIFRPKEKRLVGAVWDKEASQKIAELSFDELSESISELSIAPCEQISDLFADVAVVYEDMLGNEEKRLFILLDPPLSKWSRPWSFAQYYIAFKDQISKGARRDVKTFDLDHRSSFISIRCNCVEIVDFATDIPLLDVLADVWPYVADVHEATKRELTTNLNRGSLVTFFNFPPAVKVACEQYLQYFIQFLDDLGIEADSQISSDAGRVLFSVTPRSDKEALGTIQEALTAYLELAKQSEMGGLDMTTDMAVSQLKANILHLQGQLVLAKGMLQLGQATVQLKDQLINAQEMQLAWFQSGQLVQPGLLESRRIDQAHGDHKSQPEPLLGDIVKVTTFKKMGVEIDLAEVLRRLKRKFPGFGSR